ncbi:GNAT family N-acetyltransferase [Alteromonas sp. ASW11-19]|uniref:GNAT family N-acetyltransferase n=1 Tax=Alteromonas salexigens TaxID=2982530 RepID=A0ABT2VJ20_9ALTE|nr:GNAT family N-acetyltransferase [Alteromonas salexigens]MCU7553203.1 GNAT family N-acetyltransferase [Alteromonas salexigens]
MITFQPTADEIAAAELTFANMQSYYQRYSVSWDAGQIAAMTAGLNNLDIISDGQRVGVVRLSFEDSVCHLRDLQIKPAFQNTGLGTQTLHAISQLALTANSSELKLKVFQSSPAAALYLRNGFVTERQDDRFFYMVKELSLAEHMDDAESASAR